MPSVNHSDRQRRDALLHVASSGRWRAVQLEVVIEQPQLDVVAQAVPEIPGPGERYAGPRALAGSRAGIAAEVPVRDARRELVLADRKSVAQAQVGAAVSLPGEQVAAAPEVVSRVVPSSEHRELVLEAVAEREVGDRGLDGLVVGRRAALVERQLGVEPNEDPPEALAHAEIHDPEGMRALASAAVGELEARHAEPGAEDRAVRIVLRP